MGSQDDDNADDANDVDDINEGNQGNTETPQMASKDHDTYMDIVSLNDNSDVGDDDNGANDNVTVTNDFHMTEDESYDEEETEDPYNNAITIDDINIVTEMNMLQMAIQQEEQQQDNDEVPAHRYNLRK